KAKRNSRLREASQFQGEFRHIIRTNDSTPDVVYSFRPRKLVGENKTLHDALEERYSKIAPEVKKKTEAIKESVKKKAEPVARATRWAVLSQTFDSLDPMSLYDSLADEYSALGELFPELGNGLPEAAVSSLQFLASKKPKNPLVGT